MQNLKKIFFPLFLLISSISFAQQNAIITDYINNYRELAIAEMQRTGVPASIKLAQGIHETMAGQSDLVRRSNNHFGIKCKSDWKGESVSHDDDLRGECFRKYPSANDSYRDHSNFLKNGQRYAFLFALDPTDYKGWAYGLKKAGYATNPKYSQVLIKLIEDYNLQDYTLIALGKKEPGDIVFASNDKTAEAKVEPVAPLYVEEKKPAKPVITYPQGEFKINDTRVVFVTKGTSYLSIAQQYNVSLSRLFEFNELLEAETANNDQLVYLQRKRKTGSNEFHIVSEGETLRDIAQAEGLRLESLLEYNSLKAHMTPAPGEQLSLRTKSEVAPKLISNKPAANDLVWTTSQQSSSAAFATTISHTVKAGETIPSIAKLHNVKINDIVEWNKLTGARLKPGQVLKIYK